MNRKLRQLTTMAAATVALLLCAGNGWSLTTGVASPAPIEVSVHDYYGTAQFNSTEGWQAPVAVTAFTYDDAIVQAPKAIRQSDASPAAPNASSYWIPHLLPRPPPTDASTTISRFLNAPRSEALVKYEPDFAAQQILDSPTNVTPGGRTVTAHAAERMVTPPAGRAPTTMAEVDQFLDTATQVRKVTPHPLGDTITLRNANAPRIKEVVVDAATGKRVITVITPKR